MLLFRTWPRPPKLDAGAYLRYRLRLAVLLVVWLLAVVAIVFFWQQLPLLLKGTAVVVGIVIAPDVTTFRQVFSSYARYAQRGLE